MGMSGSQARLLSLTARLHDVELKAQNIQSKKIALATQKDEVFQEYCDALDAKSIKVAFRDGDNSISYEAANYSTLCGYSEYRRKNYTLRDNRTGQILVSNDIKNAYDGFGKDKYAFVYALLGFSNEFGWQNEYGNDAYRTMGSDIGIGKSNEDWVAAGFKYAHTSVDNAGNISCSLYMTEAESMAYENYIAANPNSELESKYETLVDTQDKDVETQKEALKSFRETLYSVCEEAIFNSMNINKNGEKGNSNDNELLIPNSDWSDFENEFDYYLQLWEAITEAGGCKVIEPQYESGEAGNKWFNNMVDAGLVSILVWDTNGSGKNCWSETSVATSTNENYLQKIEDPDWQKKAEVKYEQELSIINDKDKRYDQDLNKLETTRTAIKTEMDSISKVRDDNVERTFGIFS